MIKFTYDEIADAVIGNQTKKIAEMLDSLDLRKDGIPPCFTTTGKEVTTIMLGFASVTAWREELNEDLADELIERTAMTVNIFSFLRLIAIAADIGPVSLNTIPKDVRMALRNNDYSDKIARVIEDSMNDEAFAALIAYLLSGKIEQTHVKFNLPIIRRTYSSEVVPLYILFVFMGLCPRETADDRMNRVIHDGLDGLLFGLMLDEMSEDEEGEEEE